MSHTSLAQFMTKKRNFKSFDTATGFTIKDTNISMFHKIIINLLNQHASSFLLIKINT